MSEYKINNSNYPPGTMCANPECGHSISAHGSNGMMCCACRCKQFLDVAPTAGAEKKCD